MIAQYCVKAREREKTICAASLAVSFRSNSVHLGCTLSEQSAEPLQQPAPAPGSLGPGSDPDSPDTRTGSQAPDVDPHLAALIEAVSAGDLDRAVVVVREGWFDLLKLGGAAFRANLQDLPTRAILEYPLLTMLLSVGYYARPHRRLTSIRYFVTAINAAKSKKRTGSAVDRALILASAGVAYRLAGRAGAGVDAARTAIRILGELTVEQHRQIQGMARLYAQVGITLYYAGQIDEALDAFEFGLAEAQSDAYEHGFSSVSMIAGIRALQGEIPEAETYLALARRPGWDASERSTYTGTFYRIAEATVALERFDVSTAREHLAAMVHERRTIEHWVTIAVAEAWTELVDGNPGAALSGLDAFAAMRDGEGRSAAARNKLAPMRALLQLALGSPDAAHTILRRDATRGFSRSIGLARTELALGRHGAALQHVRDMAGSTMPPRALAEATTVEAAALLRFSDRARTLTVVEQLGSLLERTQQRLAATLVPQSDFTRIRTALQDAGYTEIVKSLPSESRFPDPDPGTLLTERELAVLEKLLQTPSATRIAAELVVSVNTVKTQLKSVYRKLGASNRDEAIAVALDRHLLVKDSD